MIDTDLQIIVLITHNAGDDERHQEFSYTFSRCVYWGHSIFW